MLSFLFPIIKAQGTEYSPEGKSFFIDPGITTDLDGISPLYSIGFLPLTSIIFVEAVRTTLAPRTASSSIFTPSTTMHLEPTKTLSSMITGAA